MSNTFLLKQFSKNPWVMIGGADPASAAPEAPEAQAASAAPEAASAAPEAVTPTEAQAQSQLTLSAVTPTEIGSQAPAPAPAQLTQELDKGIGYGDDMVDEEPIDSDFLNRRLGLGNENEEKEFLKHLEDTTGVGQDFSVDEPGDDGKPLGPKNIKGMDDMEIEKKKDLKDTDEIQLDNDPQEQIKASQDLINELYYTVSRSNSSYNSLFVSVALATGILVFGQLLHGNPSLNQTAISVIIFLVISKIFFSSLVIRGSSIEKYLRGSFNVTLVFFVATYYLIFWINEKYCNIISANTGDGDTCDTNGNVTLLKVICIFLCLLLVIFGLKFESVNKRCSNKSIKKGMIIGAIIGLISHILYYAIARDHSGGHYLLVDLLI